MGSAYYTAITLTKFKGQALVPSKNSFIDEMYDSDEQLTFWAIDKKAAAPIDDFLAERPEVQKSLVEWIRAHRRWGKLYLEWCEERADIIYGS